MSYIWQLEDWPGFFYSREKIEDEYNKFLYAKGLADASFNLLPLPAKTNVLADAITQDAVYSSEIEGETLIYDSVYSSVMKNLDATFVASGNKDKNSQSVADILFDACNNHGNITVERLLSWNKALFTGKAKCYVPERCGQLRNKPVYVVHHLPKGNEEMIFEAVPASDVENELNKLITWINEPNIENSLIKSAIAGLWFVTIHPFSDGNGRISRALSDYVLSKDSTIKAKYYSVSASILRNKREYYSILEKTQKQKSMDITDWIIWYAKNVTESLYLAKETCAAKIKTALFIHKLPPDKFNSRQLHVLYKLADGTFAGKLTADKWMKMTKCQSATATRDLGFLVDSKLLIRLGTSGKNFYYVLNPETVSL